MPPRLGDVVALTDLGLTVATAPPEAMQRPVRWVAVSELEDPARWLEGGELLLTTGLRLPLERRACDRYVRRLAAADVTALGLAVGLTHDEVPAVLVRAAERAGLPVLEVPRPTPFLAISKAVSGLVAAEEYEDAARAFAAQRALIRAVLGADDGGAGAVVALLARHLDGDVVQLDGSGRVVHAAPAAAAGRVGDLDGEVARLRPRGLLASAVVATADRHVVIQPLGVRGRARGFLVVATGAPPAPPEQALVSLAVSLLSLALERTDAHSAADRGLRALALRLLVTGRAAEVPVEALGWGPLTAGPVVVVLALPDPAGDADALAERLADAVDAAAAVGALPDRPEAVLAVVPAGQAVAALSAIAASPPSSGLGPAAGGSDPVGLDDAEALATAVAQAQRALAAAQAGSDPGRRALLHTDLGSAGLDALLDAGATRAWAQALLAPLAGERADLLATLRAWLAHHGQVDAAAQVLGVHRHTVRHRLRRAESLLRRPLDDPTVRAELWVALSHAGLSDQEHPR